MSIPYVIVPGNHDLRKKNLNRTNSVETIVKLINNPKIIYFDKSGFFNDNISNIIWVNHSHIEKNINPNYVDYNQIKYDIREKLSDFLYEQTECKPMIIAVVQEV